MASYAWLPMVGVDSVGSIGVGRVGVDSVGIGVPFKISVWGLAPVSFKMFKNI